METLSRCSLQDMLASRDRRRERQMIHFQTTPAATLVVATVVAPGEFKLTPRTGIVAQAMIESLKKHFGPHILTIGHQAFVSGHEVWLTLDCPAVEAKKTAVLIEDTHLLGRLFDIDVILSEMRPMSRVDIGQSPRKCLLCQNEARICMRSRQHSPEEINEHIESLIREYVNAR